MFTPLALVLRRFRRQAAFTCVAVVTLALGIGASTAIFSALDAALLRPLPYTQPEDIYTLRTTITDGRFTSGLVAGLELQRLKEASNEVVAVAATRREDQTIVRGQSADSVVGYEVSPGFFELFGLRLAAGQGFAPEHHRFPRAGDLRHVVVSHRLWRQMFDADPAVVGSVLRTPTQSLVVVGVANAAFAEPAHADLWMAVPLEPSIGHSYNGYLRLRPGATIARVQGSMLAVMRQLADEFPDQNRNRIFVGTPMLQAVVGDLEAILIIVFGATVLLLILAAANVTNLLLARGTSRTREMAVRVALGASRGRLVRELVLESLTLTTVGGLCGIALAAGAIRLLAQFGMAQLPRLAAVTLEPRVLLFAVVTMAVTGILVAMLPSTTLLRTAPRALLAADTRTTTGSPLTRRLLGGMIVAEIAVAIVLVAGAGRLIQQFSDLLAIETGFTSDERVVASMVLPWRPVRDAVPIRAFAATMRERLRPLGATAVSIASSIPLGHEWDDTAFIDFADRPEPDPQSRPNARWRQVSPDYFGVMGIKVVAGRSFLESDDERAPGAIVVNTAFVRRFISPGNPIGRRVRLPGFRTRREGQRTITDPSTIVGVVADVRHAALGRAPEQTIYTSFGQQLSARQSFIVAGDSQALDALMPSVRRIVHEVEPRIAVDVTRLSTLRAASLSRERLGMMLMLLFGVTALVLSIVGVLGVITYVVGQRLGEMALRLALGGTAASVFWLVVRQGARLAWWGGASGIVVAWWTGRLMMRFGGESSASAEWIAISGSAAIVIGAALATTSMVARRAARVDPSCALRP